MRRATALAPLLALACPGCREADRAPPQRWLPADGSAAVLVAELGQAARQLGSLVRSAGAVPAAARVGEAHAAARAQLGFDPLDPRGLSEAGLDPAGGAGVSFATNRPAVAVLPLLDPSRFEATVRRLARDRLGAAERVAGLGGGHEVITFRSRAAAPAALAYAVAGRYAIVATGGEAPAAVAAAASLAEPRSLLRSRDFGAAAAAVAEGFSAMAYAPRGSPLLAGVPAARDGAALGLRAGGAGLWLRAALLLATDRAPDWAALAGAGPEAARAAGREEVRLLGSDAVLAARFGGDLGALWRRLRRFLPGRLAGALAASRLDVESELLSSLAPGAALSLSLAPTFRVADLSSPSPDLRGLDPFRLFRLELVARLRHPAAARDFSARLGRAAPRFGGRLAARGDNWTLAYRRGEIAWSLSGDRLLLATGPGRLEALRRRVAAGAGGYQAPSPSARGALEGGVAGAVLDVGRLVEGVRGLPDEAFGTGPDAFVMRALADRLLDPASRVQAASLRFDLLPGAALLDLHIEGGEAPGAGAP